MKRSIIIVGAGPAGVAAAIQCRRIGAAPLLLDRTGEAGGLVSNAYSVENYPGIESPIGGSAFAGRLQDQLQRFEISVERAEVVSIARDGSDCRVVCGAGELRAAAVILACGTEPLRLGLPNEEECAGDSLFYEVRALLERRPAPRAVVVVGGGEAACDYALTLAAAGAAVRLAVRSGRLRARGRLAEAVGRARGVHVSFGTVCEAFAPSPSPAVRLRSSGDGGANEQAVDALLVAVGRRSAAPRLLGISGSARHEGSAAPMPGVFVAGDAGRGGLGQIGMAVGDGMRAAVEAAAFAEERR